MFYTKVSDVLWSGWERTEMSHLCMRFHYDNGFDKQQDTVMGLKNLLGTGEPVISWWWEQKKCLFSCWTGSWRSCLSQLLYEAEKLFYSGTECQGKIFLLLVLFLRQWSWSDEGFRITVWSKVVWQFWNLFGRRMERGVSGFWWY